MCLTFQPVQIGKFCTPIWIDLKKKRESFMAVDKFFQFTIGPVQGFVSQARRTRDFWAGSFLLSWLAGVAMAEVQRQHGEINFPVPPNGYLDWITGKGQGEAPRQGAIPNRFKAFHFKVPENFDSKLVIQSVRDAWFLMAEHVWLKDELSRCAGLRMHTTRSIWERQHRHFWDISWILSEDDGDSSLLDQRKNWRTHYGEAEPGVKCMMMDGWQELSGSERPGKTGDAFWQEVRQGKETDIGPKEQLCALAYVKRRFARHFESFSATLPSGLKLHGWTLETGMPSVSYMAAVHWLEQVVQQATPEDAWLLLDAARAVSRSQDEWDTHIPCLKEAAGRGASDNDKRHLLSLDASVFFEHVQNDPKANDLDERAIKSLQHEMQRFRRAHPDVDAHPSPFYAILMMDGDSLGSQMSNKANQRPISDALNAFTAAVPAIVQKHNGMLIYAGGDDVLAVLPVEDALRCAAKVRDVYLKSFKSSNIPTTISAAIEFAHVKTPLAKVLGDSHKLLDDVAKDGAGRDAVAVRVWKTGRMTLEWAQPWKVALDDKGQVLIEEMARAFNERDTEMGHVGAFSNKFFFKIRERFDLLNPTKPGAVRVLSDEESVDLLAVDYVNSANNRKQVDMAIARSVIQPLLKQCRAVKRDLNEADTAKWEKNPLLRVDGALLVRFLAQKGVEA
jgi:CRISPR-associated protein Cmr2